MELKDRKFEHKGQVIFAKFRITYYYTANTDEYNMVQCPSKPPNAEYYLRIVDFKKSQFYKLYYKVIELFAQEG